MGCRAARTVESTPTTKGGKGEGREAHRREPGTDEAGVGGAVIVAVSPLNGWDGTHE